MTQRPFMTKETASWEPAIYTREIAEAKAREETIRALETALLLAKQAERAISSRLHALGCEAIVPDWDDAAAARFVEESAETLAVSLGVRG